MLKRRPELPKTMAGGIANPLGARAMYLYNERGDTMYRIHGTNEPDTIGQAVSSGCIRLLNADIIDLYQRVKVGATVVVLVLNTNRSARAKSRKLLARKMHARPWLALCAIREPANRPLVPAGPWMFSPKERVGYAPYAACRQLRIAGSRSSDILFAATRTIG